MPLVLSTHEGKESQGYKYDDRTGVSYEYPTGRYENWIQTGERFVYHTPGHGYSGVGIIGDITASVTPGRLVCKVLDFDPFSGFVSLQDDAGAYYEADKQYWSTGNIYWAQGVRPLSAARFEAIVTRSSAPASSKTPQKRAGHGYASPDVSIEVDKYAMKAAMEHVTAKFPGFVVTQMPKNNPGFDIRVGPQGAEHRFVEVKGTQASEPLFFLTEGERRFSGKEKDRYSLLVITGINLKKQTDTGRHWRDGQIDAAVAELEPSQWRGRLL